jgi:alginate O-acetyltransferase complex protein AlgI
VVFSSSIFLFVFLPLFLSVYYVVPARLRTLVILLGSYVFFGWWRYDFLFLLIGVTTWSWAWSHAVARAPSPALKRLALTIGVVGDLGVLAGFKYTSFVMGNLYKCSWMHITKVKPIEYIAFRCGVVLFPLGVD